MNDPSSMGLTTKEASSALANIASVVEVTVTANLILFA